MTKRIGWTVLCVGLLAVGCSKTESKEAVSDTKAMDKPADKPAEKPADKPADKTADKPADHGAAPAVTGAAAIPDIPDTQSNPPTVAEWEAAAHINTVGANSAAKDCSMKLVREWLKVNCTGKIEDVTNQEGFGKKGFDYFESVKPGTLADYVIRLKKGTSVKARINRDKDRASLFVSWPGGAPKPTIIALQEGQKT